MVISNSVKAIGRQAFGACYGLTGKLVIGHSLTTIKEWAFDGCDNITSLIYNAKNCTNTYYCFSYLSSVKTITIGSDVRSLPQHAFNNCSFVQSIISERDAPPRADSIAFQGIPTLQQLACCKGECADGQESVDGTEGCHGTKGPGNLHARTIL